MKKYLTNSQVRTRYGGKSAMWVWRRIKNDPLFPRPLYIGRRQHFDEAELNAFDEKMRAAGCNSNAAA